MSYHSKQLNNGRWGIFVQEKLVATIGCYETCQKIIYYLENRPSEQKIPVLMESYGVKGDGWNLKLKS